MNHFPNELQRTLGRVYQAGETIFSQGEEADTIFVMQKGKVELVCDIPGGVHRMRILKAGEMFGEAATFTANKRRTATARAVTKVRVLTIDERTLLTRLHQDPGLSFRLLRHMAQRIQDYSIERTTLLQKSKKMRRRKQLKAKKFRGKLPNVHNFSVAYHILIIEDDPEFTSLLTRWFKTASKDKANQLLPSGFKVTAVSSLKAGLARLSREKFDACLLDLNLSDSQGIVTFHQLYQRYPDTPIVILTAQDDDACAISCVQNGAQDFLIKQRVQGDVVRHALQFAIERHRQEASANDVDPMEQEGSAWSDERSPFPRTIPQRIRDTIGQWRDSGS